MDIENTRLAASPVTLIAKAVNIDIVELGFQGEPLLWPEQPGIVAFPPCLAGSTTESVYKDEVYKWLGGCRE